MNLTQAEQQQLYIAVAAAVQGALVRGGKQQRMKPLLAANEAKAHALAAVRVARENGNSK